jgi:chemotaxis protein MotB
VALPDEEEAPAGAPDWIVTYGDMMSLLLTFFVLLFSMSEIREEQSRAMMDSMRRAFGSETSLESILAGPNVPLNSPLAKLMSLGRSRRMDTMQGGDKVNAPVGEHPRVWAIRPSQESTLGGAIFFDESSAELTEQAKQVLQKIAEQIAGKPQKIEIRGHTSKAPLPPNSPYHNHWDLAYARCVNTMEYLVTMGIEPQRMRLAVAGEHEPLHISTDPKLQQSNSRVEVALMSELAKSLEGTEKEKQERFSSDAPK